MILNILEIEDLAVSFKTSRGSVKAVRGIFFELHKGETLAIVGESGSGKSVTAKAIMGILSHNAIVEDGRIGFEEKNLLRIKEKEFNNIRGNKISMIFQDPMSSLDPIMKTGKQITETIVLNDTTGKVSRKEAYGRALQLMRDVGIDNPEKRFNQYPFELSGGMRQRIVIAIAIAANPDILICDEPTTALDVTIQAQILELLQELQKKIQLSIIFITHDLGVVAKVADRIAVMYAGKIVEIGTAEDIFYNPKHPYTWALMSSMPDLESKERLTPIPGNPPDMINPPKGDAFASRNKYAMEIDFEEEPPFFEISDTHKAATWLLHPLAPKVEMPQVIQERIERMRKLRELAPGGQSEVENG